MDLHGLEWHKNDGNNIHFLKFCRTVWDSFESLGIFFIPLVGNWIIK